MANSKYSALCTITFRWSQKLEPSGLAPYFFPRRALEIMLAKCENIRDAVKALITGFWITFGVCSVGVHGQEGKKNPIFVDAFDKIKKVTREFYVKQPVLLLLTSSKKKTDKLLVYFNFNGKFLFIVACFKVFSEVRQVPVANRL